MNDLFNIENLKINIYDHGGSRVYLEDKNGNRELICDTYGGKDNKILMKMRKELHEIIKKILSENK